MREKELRIALVCYGGISLAVYMHGITKEVWRLARASRAYHAGEAPADGSEAVYHHLLERIGREGEMQLRVLWEEIMQRFRFIEITGEIERVQSSFVKGYSSMPVTLHAW